MNTADCFAFFREKGGEAVCHAGCWRQTAIEADDLYKSPGEIASEIQVNSWMSLEEGFTGGNTSSIFR